MIQFPPVNILVPFDFSQTAHAALLTAQSLARRFQSRIEVFYVAPGLKEEGRGHAAASRGVLRKLAKAAGPGVSLALAEGEASAAIVRHARYGVADLIVMGTEGRVGLRRLRAGSVAEAVVRDSSVPVLTVHEPSEHLISVLAPVNLEPYAEAGLLAAAQAAAELGAELTVLHVLTSRDDARAAAAREKLQGLINALPAPLRRGCAPLLRLEYGDPVQVVLDAAPGYGLVVMVARRKSAVGDVVLGTTAEQVLRRSAVPVLAVPCPEVDEPAKGDGLWIAPVLPPF